MEAVGVEAVVEGLSGFLGDMKKMDSAISGLVPGTKLLQNAFGFLGDTIDGVVNFTLNALAHALGELVADAVEFVIQKLGELVDATIEAGGEFQTLELRLQTLNFNTLTESGETFNDATAKSIELTKQQLEWLQKLAVATPYDAADIANVFTLARSYGFASDEAKTLTESITNFASGMGLGSTEIERIIVNFGQMVQQGKVTQREMNDLARGSFVPVNDVLLQMSKDTGIAMDAMDDFRKTAESVPAFMKAFIELVDTRFRGASEKMARTFQGATANLQDFVKSLGGMNIVKPILDVVGGRIADFISDLTDPKNWDKLVAAASDVGAELSSLASTLMSILLPSGKHAAEGVVGALEGIADWFRKHRGDITDWIIASSRWINNVLIPDIKNIIKWLFGSDQEEGAIQKFGKWLEETFLPLLGKVWKWVDETLIPFLEDKLPGLLDALGSLGDSILEVIGAIFDNGDTADTSWVDDLTTGIKDFATWVSDNKDAIAEWVVKLITATVYLAILIALIGTAVGWVLTITVAFANWVVVSEETNKWLLLLGIAATGLGLALLGLASPLLIIVAGIAAIILILKVLWTEFEVIKKAFAIWVQYFTDLFALWKDNFTQTIQEVKDALANGDWVGAGKAIVDGIARGFSGSWDLVIDLIKNLAQSAIDTWKEAFGINFDITDALGIGRGNPPGAPASVPASSSVNSSTVHNNNYNLSINSSAQTEPIVQDFNMMASLHGRQ